MSATPKSIEVTLRNSVDSLTRTERHLATYFLRNYPMALMGSVNQIAKAADVSAPSIVRFAKKLGYSGFQELQAAVRGELEARLESPLAKHDRWAENAPDTHILNRFADAVLGNLQNTLAQIDHAQFDAATRLMSDPNRKVFATGGRITLAMAEYFVTQMKVIRPNVELLLPVSNTWPPALLEMKPGDIVLAFDIRRYENNVLQLVELAKDQGAEVILVTDPWVSPASAHASYRFSAQIEVPSAWDSNVAIQLLVETMLASVQALTWKDTSARMSRLEELYEKARFFRGRR